jgi:hypothetical protein
MPTVARQPGPKPCLSTRSPACCWPLSTRPRTNPQSSRGGANGGRAFFQRGAKSWWVVGDRRQPSGHAVVQLTSGSNASISARGRAAACLARDGISCVRHPARLTVPCVRRAGDVAVVRPGLGSARQSGGGVPAGPQYASPSQSQVLTRRFSNRQIPGVVRIRPVPVGRVACTGDPRAIGLPRRQH